MRKKISFEITAPEVGEVVSGRKKLETIADVVKQQSVEQVVPELFLDKIGRKNSRSCKDTWAKNLSSKKLFRYGAVTIFSFEIFNKNPILESITSSYTHEVFPDTSLNEAVLSLNLKRIVISTWIVV